MLDRLCSIISANPDQDMQSDVVQCEQCAAPLSVPGDKLCSVQCMQEIAAIRGRVLGSTTFKSTLRDFADAMAEYRRTVLAATEREAYAPTAEDQKIRARNVKAVNDAQSRLFAKSMAIGDMIKKVRSPGSVRGSTAEGEAVNRAVAASYQKWLMHLQAPTTNYPNDMFTPVAMAVATFMAGWGSINEGFSNILALLRNYSEFSLTTAQEKVYRKELVDGAADIGAQFDESYKKHMADLKGKTKK